MQNLFDAVREIFTTNDFTKLRFQVDLDDIVRNLGPILLIGADVSLIRMVLNQTRSHVDLHLLKCDELGGYTLQRDQYSRIASVSTITQGTSYPVVILSLKTADKIELVKAGNLADSNLVIFARDNLIAFNRKGDDFFIRPKR